MAMNKKEKAEFDAAIKAVFVARALNWTEPVNPDIPVSNGSAVLNRGYSVWTMGNSPHASFAISSSTGHATSQHEQPKRTTTQRAIPLYSTKILALRALRHALEKTYAESLADIDMQIQAELAQPGKENG